MNSEINLIPQLNFWSVLLLICAGQGFFFSFMFLIHKKGNKIANKFLGTLILFFSLYFVFIASFWSKYLIEFPHLMHIVGIVNYLWGPLFYLYVAELLEKNKKFNYKRLFHFIPAVISIIYSSRTYFIDTERKVNFVKNMLSDEASAASTFSLFLGLLVILHIFVYTIMSVKKLEKFSEKMKSAVNTLEYINYNWLRKLSYGFVGFFVSWFIYEIVMYAGIKYYAEVDYVITFFGVFIVYTVAIYTLRQPEIISGTSDIKNEPRYEKSVIPTEEAQMYLSQLDVSMDGDNLYLNSELNIRMLAETVGTSPHRLSQIINEYKKMSFPDYLNNYRIEEVKKRLVNPKFADMTILAIAYDTGFNNKTTFNNAFKKFTGLTPSEFRTNETLSIADKN